MSSHSHFSFSMEMITTCVRVLDVVGFEMWNTALLLWERVALCMKNVSNKACWAF